MNQNNPKGRADGWTMSPWVLARPSSGDLQKQKTLKQSKCLTVQQENPFYYNLIKLIVKQRPCSTKTHSSHASCSVFSGNGSQVHPQGIPPREVNPCKGHCVNHHTLSLAAAVGNCLWRSRNETLVNPSPNITKIKHHHYPPTNDPEPPALRSWWTSSAHLRRDVVLTSGKSSSI